MSSFSPSDQANWSPRPIALTISPFPIPYQTAMAAMDRAVADIIEGSGPERIWFLEHPPLYTAGTTAKIEDLRDPDRFEVHKSPRGGQYTYHGPGQRVAYVMLDLKERKQDVRRYVADLEAWIIGALARFNVEGAIRDGRVGVWVDRSKPGAPHEDKIAAIGVRIRRWVTFHGIAINVEPELEHFTGITPCGIEDSQFGVTSLVDLGLPVTMGEVDAALMASFGDVFGPLEETQDTQWLEPRGEE